MPGPIRAAGRCAPCDDAAGVELSQGPSAATRTPQCMP
jgi:hypothetical protein